MRRISYWVLATLSALVLLFGYHTSTSSTMAAAGTPSAVVSTGGAGTSTGTGATSDTTTVTGAVASTQWGPVQVRLTMQGDTIAGVDVLQYPNGNPKDDEINSYALPILVQETEQSGNAQIDMVSGATVTSTGYLESLQSALEQVGA